MPGIHRGKPSIFFGGIIFKIVLLFWLLHLPTPVVTAAPPEPMLPDVYDGDVEIGGWLMSEKLDGVRGYWDGRHLWSKGGRKFTPPAEFVQGLPGYPLEGELWGGRGTYEKTLSTVLKQTTHGGWLKLKFAIFDAPEARGGFSRRIEKVRAWFTARPSGYAFVIPQLPVRDKAHLQEELRRVEERGGEGLIVRRPDAPYVAGRSPDILKVKNYEDAEAVVIEHLPGQGRNQGVMGSLLVELPNGTRFRLGTGFSDAERKDPPAVGETVTFKYYGTFASGVPRFPSFLRIRREPKL